MSGPAHVAAFKSQTAELIDRLHLTPKEVVGLGLALAASHGLGAAIPRAFLVEALEESIEAAAARTPGIVTVRGAE